MKKIAIAALAVCIGLTSCKDLAELNIDPNLSLIHI